MKQPKLSTGLFSKIINMLMRERKRKDSQLSDYDKLRYEIKPGDVLLIAGRSRVSEVIKLTTQSHWSHAALYIGRLHDFEDPTLHELLAEHYQGQASAQLLVESVMGKGTVITPLEHYKHEHSRLCRPIGIARQDVQNVIQYAILRLGGQYDVRQIFDLARFLLPWSLLPRRWRSCLFRYNPGTLTKQSCTSLIGEAFIDSDFPILPHVRKRDDQEVEFVHRLPRLYTPSDFDFSPYFDIIKYPLLTKPGEAVYHHLPWSKENIASDTEGKLYPSEETPEKNEQPDSEQETSKEPDEKQPEDNNDAETTPTENQEPKEDSNVDQTPNQNNKK